MAKANQEADRRQVARTHAARAPREPAAGQVVETESGMYLIDRVTGHARQVTLPGAAGTGAGPTPDGTQPLPGKKMNEHQSKAFNFGSRALQASQILDQLEAAGVTGQNFYAYLAENAGVVGAGIGGALGAGAGIILGIVTGGPGWVTTPTGTGIGAGLGGGLGVVLATPLANALRSADEQRYAAAKLDFIAAVLRKESGAAITRDEAAREDRRYFGQSGEDPPVLAQKRQARLQVLATLATEAGRPLALPQPPPQGTPQTPRDAGIIPMPGGGHEAVKVPTKAPASTPAPPGARPDGPAAQDA